MVCYYERVKFNDGKGVQEQFLLIKKTPQHMAVFIHL